MLSAGWLGRRYVRSSARADEQPYITELDFQLASLPLETIHFLGENMPRWVDANDARDELVGKEPSYDCALQTHELSDSNADVD